jgi:curved DNA-binding protein CbpA/lysophospholipase L1-like esterase
MDSIEQALAVLGLDNTASSIDIDQAYRDLAMVWHPDRFPGESRLRNRAQKKFKEINAAYEALKKSNYQTTNQRARSSEQPRNSSNTSGPGPEQPKSKWEAKASSGSTPAAKIFAALQLGSSHMRLIAYCVAVIAGTYVVVNLSAVFRTSNKASAETKARDQINTVDGSKASILPVKSESIPDTSNADNLESVPVSTTASDSTKHRLPESLPAKWWEKDKIAPGTSKSAQSDTSKSAIQSNTTTNFGVLFNLHWIDRVKFFRDENKTLATEHNVILVGDSTTEGFSAPKYFPDWHVLNRGIAADVVGNALPQSDKRGILRRMDESIFDCSPADVFLLVGINDIGMGHKLETIENGYRKILERVKSRAPEVKLHVQSVLPTRGNFAKHNANVNDLNKRLHILAKEFGDDYIDLHSKMADDKGELREEFTADGLHLTDPGYQVWKAEIVASFSRMSPRLIPAVFTIGSTRDDVLRIQGTPTSIQSYKALDEEVFSYNFSHVKLSIKTGLVKQWQNSGNLKASLLPGRNITNSMSFTLGSHRDDVLRLQGTPSAIAQYPALDEEILTFGFSSVKLSLKSQRVREWNNSGNLNVSLAPTNSE